MLCPAHSYGSGRKYLLAVVVNLLRVPVFLFAVSSLLAGSMEMLNPAGDRVGALYLRPACSLAHGTQICLEYTHTVDSLLLMDRLASLAST